MQATNTDRLRQLAEDATEQLAVMHGKSPTRTELQPFILAVLDQVTLYLTTRHGVIPEPALKILESVMQSAREGNAPRVIHQTLNALDTSDRFVKAQSTKRTATDVETDKLLKALQRKKLPNV